MTRPVYPNKNRLNSIRQIQKAMRKQRLLKKPVYPNKSRLGQVLTVKRLLAAQKPAPKKPLKTIRKKKPKK